MRSNSKSFNWLVYALQHAKSIWESKWRTDQMDKKVWKFVFYLSKIKKEKRVMYKEGILNGDLFVIFKRGYFNICCNYA
jgi:hypothetical protein